MVDKKRLASQQQAFIDLVYDHQAILHRICSVYGDTTDDRKDLYQEILYQLWRAYPTFDGRSKFMILPLGSIIYGCLNLFGHSSNTNMMLVLSGMLLLSVSTLIYGVNLSWTHARIQKHNMDLVTTLQHQLSFYRTRYEM